MFDWNELNFDFDGDGIPDSHAELIDSNGDGIPDTYYIETDTDGDGMLDQLVEGHDYDQDGIFESVKEFHDLDHDGSFEEVIKSYDADLDGQFDTSTTYLDIDRDGRADIIVQEQMIYDGNTAAGEMEPGTVGQAGGYVCGTCADELSQFDPAHADMDAVSGDPATSMEKWEFQGDTGRCALYSQKFIIEEMTGHDIDIEDFAATARENGWFAEEDGTPLLNMNKMLDYYGIQNEMTFHNSISDIRECLDSGGKVIVSIDADEIWYGENDDIFTPADGVNHAVEVIGIDNTDPDHPMVILNDSGSPNGCGEMVPLDTFVDAWEDGDCQMIGCIGSYNTEEV